jgi:high-affinity iron transporter
MVAYFLIGLREGLEATLVVSILVAFLVKSQRRQHLRYVWAGVGGALALSLALGALIIVTASALLTDFRSQELFEAVLSITAVGFVTWMIFWMRRTARHLKGELHEKLEAALGVGPVAVAVVAFLAVAREGLETVLLFWASAQTAVVSPYAAVGALTGGVAAAVVLGWLIYRGAVRINLSTFFTWTGVVLVLVAAGILAYGVHDLQEAGVLAGQGVKAFDISTVISPTGWLGTVLGGIFNFNPAPTVAEAIAWVAYLVPVLAYFLWPQRPKATPKPSPEPAQQAA